MVYSGAHPSAPTVEISEIFDPAQANSPFEFFDQDLVQLASRTTLKARRVIVRLDGCALVYYATNVRVRTRPTLNKDMLGFVAYGPHATGTVNGLPVRSDALFALPAGHGAAMVAEPGYESATFLVPPEDLGEHLTTRGGELGLLTLNEPELLEVGAGHTGALFTWAKRLIDAAVEQPSLFNDSSQRRAAARVDLMDTLCSSLAVTSRVELDRRDRTRQAKSDIVRTAEEYALAHTDDQLYIKDLCRAAGVSERTLEYAFREVMGLSPTAYLTRIRLHKVHEALLRVSSDRTTVTQEALQWGFWHFGEFAKAYKECFHELPSDTLRRAQGS